MGIDTVRKKLGNTLFIYGLVATLLLTAVSLLQYTAILSASTHFYISMVLAFCLGIAHLPLLFRFLLSPELENFGKGLGITAILTLLGAIAAAIVYYFCHIPLSLISFVIPFLIPFLAYYAWSLYKEIPPRIYKPWYYPLEEEMPDLNMIDLGQIEVIQFVLHRKHETSSLVNFTSKAPLDMTVGQLFFIFINDYNERNPQTIIEYLDPLKTPTGWIFYRKHKWFNKRSYFDPHLSFRVNEIRPSEKVYADRLY